MFEKVFRGVVACEQRLDARATVGIVPAGAIEERAALAAWQLDRVGENLVVAIHRGATERAEVETRRGSKGESRRRMAIVDAGRTRPVRSVQSENSPVKGPSWLEFSDEVGAVVPNRPYWSHERTTRAVGDNRPYLRALAAG